MNKENASGEESLADEPPTLTSQLDAVISNSNTSTAARRRTLIICAIIFLVALGCRLLSWQDNRFEARKVQTAVTDGYKHTARLLREGGIRAFLSSDSPLSDPNHLGHPPGYSILIAIVFSAFGESESALQLIQILGDSVAAIVVFLIGLSLLSERVGMIAGLLVAVAPQFTYNSVMLLPDSLAVLPILLAVLFLIYGYKRPRLAPFIIAGGLIGLSCWLRANALLLPVFITAVVPIVHARGNRARYALAIIGGAVLVIAPLTIRNYLVYDHFVPVSLGAGQTLLEGIADYDPDRTLGIPNTDMGIMKWEAERYQRPDYYGMLFDPDGVKRERQRIAYGFGAIRSHPFWFFGVMVRRGASMLRLERVRITSADPPVTHSTTVDSAALPVWSASPQELMTNGSFESDSISRSLSPSGEMMLIQGSESGNQFTSPALSLGAKSDFVVHVPIRIEQGRVMVNVVGTNNGHLYASTIAEVQDWKSPSDQPLTMIELPLVSGSADQVKIVFANVGAIGVAPTIEIGKMQLYSLGPAGSTWTRIPRLVIRLLQRLFVTAVMLPLALFGLVLLAYARNGKSIALLLAVPAYYMCIQSALHTEYRYVMVIHYLLFVFVAVALLSAFDYLWRKLPTLIVRRKQKAAAAR